MRTGACLLALDAICSAADGNRRRAVEDIRTIFLIAEHLGSDPLLVSMLEAIAIDRLAINSLQNVLATSRFSADDLAPLRVLDNVSYRAMLKRDLRMEEAVCLAAIEQTGDGQWIMMTNRGSSVRPAPFALRWVAPVYRVFLLGDDLAAQSRFAHIPDTAAGQSYRQAKDGLQRYEQQLRNGPPGLTMVWLMPRLTFPLNAVTEAEARRRNARLGLALYCYRAKNGRFPKKPDDLTPEFIPAVPLDPFDGEPLRLKQTDHGLIVYSIGPDMIDNGGAPFDYEKQTGDITFTLPGQKAAEK